MADKRGLILNTRDCIFFTIHGTLILIICVQNSRIQIISKKDNIKRSKNTLWINKLNFGMKMELWKSCFVCETRQICWFLIGSISTILIVFFELRISLDSSFQYKPNNIIYNKVIIYNKSCEKSCFLCKTRQILIWSISTILIDFFRVKDIIGFVFSIQTQWRNL